MAVESSFPLTRILSFGAREQASPDLSLAFLINDSFFRDIAVTAYRAMLDRIAEPTLPTRTILLAPRLVVRESCGAYLPHKSK